MKARVGAAAPNPPVHDLSRGGEVVRLLDVFGDVPGRAVPLVLNFGSCT